MTSLARSIGSFLGAGAAAMLIAAPAAGHTDFVGADPHDGASLHEVPRELRLEFSDEMDPGLSTVVVEVGDSDSTSLELTSGAKATELVASVPDSLRPERGTTTRWTATFRVVSRDGHPVAGTMAFVVRTPQSESPSPSPGSLSSTPEAASPESNPRSSETPDPEAPSVPEQSSSRDSGVWPVAVGVGTLALLAFAVVTIMRMVGRDSDP